MSEPLAVCTEQLTKVYRPWLRGRPVVAVDSLTLAVERGIIFGFLGANGAGKTTTIKLLLRLAFPTSGSFWVLQPGLNPGAARARIGYLPENPTFYDHLTPEELLALYGELFAIPKPQLRRRIDELLSMVGLQRWRRVQLRQFSKGMLQRVGVAQALLNDPDLLFLDEPTSGLDPVGRREMRDLLLQLRAVGKTVLLNSHLLSEVEMVCDRVAFLRRGKLVREGTLDQLLQRQGTEVVATGLPPDFAPPVPNGYRAAREGDRLTVLLPDHDLVRPVVQSIFAAGGNLVAVTPKRESLEELFMRIEGEE